jgi:hypothetical protein
MPTSSFDGNKLPLSSAKFNEVMTYLTLSHFNNKISAANPIKHMPSSSCSTDCFRISCHLAATPFRLPSSSEPSLRISL